MKAKTSSNSLCFIFKKPSFLMQGRFTLVNLNHILVLTFLTRWYKDHNWYYSAHMTKGDKWLKTFVNLFFTGINRSRMTMNLYYITYQRMRQKRVSAQSINVLSFPWYILDKECYVINSHSYLLCHRHTRGNYFHLWSVSLQT